VKPAELLREFLWPVSDTGALFALLGFFALAKLVLAAGLFGIWLLVVTLPALSRYLVLLLEARAMGREAPTPGIELFNWIESPWNLSPLILVFLAAWGEWLLASRVSIEAAALTGAALLAVAPAMVGILAITHSPIEALDPRAWLIFIRSAGASYVLPLAASVSISFLIVKLVQAGLPAFIGELAWLYALFLFFSLTGAVAAARQLPGAFVITPPWGDGTARDRRAALNHAYGLVSRGNLDGGLDHLADFLASSDCPAEDYRWLFEQMLGWDRSDAALFLAQGYLAYLLNAGEETAAIKLVLRCLALSPDFRPAEQDRARVRLLLERRGRDDVARQLGYRE
jgi:hypothetical protein